MRNRIIVNGNEVMVTKAFERKAKIFGTEEYKLWKQVCSEISDAYMVTKTIRKNSDKKTYKNLTYANIEKFLKTQEHSEKLLEEYEHIKEQAVIQRSKYHMILAWFLQKYPDYDNYEEIFSKYAKDDKNITTDITNNNNITELKTASIQ